MRLRPALPAALLAAALAAAGCGESGGPPPRQAPVVERGVVAAVVDGDTLALGDGRRVRLVQIDAPELVGDCYGHAARRALLRLAPPGTRVLLARDPALDDVDDYGRLLRYVLVAGRNVNLALVAAGAARPSFFGGARGRYAARLVAASRRARVRGLGLWGACRAGRPAARGGG